MSLVSQYRNRSLRRSPPNPAVPGRALIFLIAAFIALPSTAKAYSWWSGWDSYAECMDYYTTNPPVPRPPHYFHYTKDQICSVIKAEDDEKLRKQEEINRVLVLSCRAESVTDAQFAACVSLAIGR
jgi:hypothetical protein